MIEKVLVFRTAQMYIVFNLLDYLTQNNCDITIVTQKSTVETLEQKYPNLKILVIDEAFFNYEKFFENKLLINELQKKKYAKVFVPSSELVFTSFKEIRRICYKLKFSYINYFMPDKKQTKGKLKFWEIQLEILLSKDLFYKVIFKLHDLIVFSYRIKSKL